MEQPPWTHQRWSPPQTLYGVKLATPCRLIDAAAISRGTVALMALQPLQQCLMLQRLDAGKMRGQMRSDASGDFATCRPSRIDGRLTQSTRLQQRSNRDVNRGLVADRPSGQSAGAVR